jgi:hypothetical protein
MVQQVKENSAQITNKIIAALDPAKLGYKRPLFVFGGPGP